MLLQVVLLLRLRLGRLLLLGQRGDARSLRVQARQLAERGRVVAAVLDPNGADSGDGDAELLGLLQDDPPERVEEVLREMGWEGRGGLRREGRLLLRLRLLELLELGESRRGGANVDLAEILGRAGTFPPHESSCSLHRRGGLRVRLDVLLRASAILKVGRRVVARPGRAWVAARGYAPSRRAGRGAGLAVEGELREMGANLEVRRFGVVGLRRAKLGVDGGGERRAGRVGLGRAGDVGVGGRGRTRFVVAASS